MDKKNMQSDESVINNFKEHYNKAAETYKLPSLTELQKEFEILDVVGREGHCPINVITFTRWYILKYANSWSNYLNEYIVPDQRYVTSMESANHLDDNDRNKIEKFMAWATYKTKCANIMQLSDDSPAKNAEFIRQMLKEWQEQKEIISNVIKKDVNAWKTSLEK